MLKADLPGVQRGGRDHRGRERPAHPAGERKAEHERSEKGFYRVERAFGRFQRQLTLPEGIDPDGGGRRLRPGRADASGSPSPRRSSRGASPSASARPARRGGHRDREVGRSGPMALFDIDARAGSARAGVLRLAHGEVPDARLRAAGLQRQRARAGRARGGRPGLRDGAGQHLPPVHHARPRADRRAGRAARFMGWERPIITDSGGFQVFSHGPRLGGRGGQAPPRRLPEPDPGHRGGGRDLPLLHRRLRALHGPRDLDGGAGRAGLGHRAGLRRVHALPRGPRLHAALHGAHPPLAGPVRGLAARARAATTRCSTASSRAGWTRTCGPSRWPPSRAPAVDGIAIGGTLGEDKEQMRQVLGWSMRGLPEAPPRHLLGIGDVDDIVHAVGAGDRHLRLRHAHPAGPPRHRPGARPRAPLADRPDQVRVARRPAAAVRGRRHAPLARLPALPGAATAS